jgi:hypothetical protein
MWGNEPSHSHVSSHFVELESRWTSTSSESNCRGQNPLDWKNIYVIEKILELRCLKWARMAHLVIKTQVMAKRRVESQIGNSIPNH